ncbi:MAG: sulfatase, partial [Bacteroidota bacterium]
VMLFDLEADPYEQHDLAGSRPSVADRALRHLAEWTRECALKSGTDRDPLLTSLKEGPLHASGKLDEYVTRLRATGRAEHVAMLRSRTPKEGK